MALLFLCLSGQKRNGWRIRRVESSIKQYEAIDNDIQSFASKASIDASLSLQSGACLAPFLGETHMLELSKCETPFMGSCV